MSDPIYPKKRTFRNILIGLGIFVLTVTFGGILVIALASDGKEGREAPRVYESTLPPVKPSATAAKAKTSPRPATIREGTWEVGSDVKPGKYRTTGAVDSSFPTCVWEIRNGEAFLDGGFTDKTSAPQIVTLKAGQTFHSAGCKDWIKR